MNCDIPYIFSTKWADGRHGCNNYVWCVEQVIVTDKRIIIIEENTSNVKTASVDDEKHGCLSFLCCCCRGGATVETGMSSAKASPSHPALIAAFSLLGTH